MSLEAYHSRLRALEHAAWELATSADSSGSSEPELIQIAVHFHPVEGTSTREAAAVARPGILAALSSAVCASASEKRADQSPSLTNASTSLWTHE